MGVTASRVRGKGSAKARTGANEGQVRASGGQGTVRWVGARRHPPGRRAGWAGFSPAALRVQVSGLRAGRFPAWGAGRAAAAACRGWAGPGPRTRDRDPGAGERGRTRAAPAALTRCRSPPRREAGSPPCSAAPLGPRGRPRGPAGLLAPRLRSASLRSAASGAQMVGAARVTPLRPANHGAGTPPPRHAHLPSPVLAARPP